jgi:hypothetical protein
MASLPIFDVVCVIRGLCAPLCEHKYSQRGENSFRNYNYFGATSASVQRHPELRNMRDAYRRMALRAGAWMRFGVDTAMMRLGTAC